MTPIQLCSKLASFKKLHGPTKLGDRTNGPYKITKVHTNGTITIELRPTITEQINIQRLIPYCADMDE